jgi:hypothetical protein
MRTKQNKGNHSSLKKQGVVKIDAKSAYQKRHVHNIDEMTKDSKKKNWKIGSNKGKDGLIMVDIRNGGGYFTEPTAKKNKITRLEK